MKIKRIFYNLLLALFLVSIGMEFCRAEPNIKVKWTIDVKGRSIKYSVTNNDSATIRWSNQVVALCRQDYEKSIIPTIASNSAYASDKLIHPYLEIVTRPLKGARVENWGSFVPPPVEIKPGETRDFSYSIADASVFNFDPTDIEKIESATFLFSFGGKLTSSTTLGYVAGKWKAVTH